MKVTAIVGVVILVLVGIALLPIAGLWSLNVLFALAIPYTLKTWAAMLVLAMMVGGSAKAGSK